MHQHEIKILLIDMMFKKVRAPSGSLSYPGRTTGADRLNHWLKMTSTYDIFLVRIGKFTAYIVAFVQHSLRFIFN